MPFLGTPMLRINQESGFSLIELIAVLAITSVLAATAVTKWPGSGINLAAEAEKLAADIRYIQSYSATHDQRYRINFFANRYGFTNLNGATALLHPITNTAQIMLPTGTTLATTNAYLAFDGRGVPYRTAVLPGTVLTVVAVVTLTSGGQSRTVQVSPETGRVVVQ